MNIISPQFGGIAFDEKYTKNAEKFTTGGLSSNIVFKGFGLHRRVKKRA